MRRAVSARPYATGHMVMLRADPWSADYGMGYEAVAEERPLPSSDPFVETTDWSRPIASSSLARGAVWFVDGVRRGGRRGVAGQDRPRVPGLFGSFEPGVV